MAFETALRQNWLYFGSSDGVRKLGNSYFVATITLNFN